MNHHINIQYTMGEITPKKHKKTPKPPRKLQVPFGSDASSLDFPTMSIGSISNLRDCNINNRHTKIRGKKNPNRGHKEYKQILENLRQTMQRKRKEIGTYGAREANGKNKYAKPENDDGDPTDRRRSESKEAIEVEGRALLIYAFLSEVIVVLQDKRERSRSQEIRAKEAPMRGLRANDERGKSATE